MKVLLLSPPLSREERYGRYAEAGSTSPQLGLLYLAAVLENHNHDVRLIDGLQENLTEEDILEAIASFGPQLVGISIATIAFYRSIQLAKVIKEKFALLPIVVGGPDVSSRLQDYGNYTEFDYAIYGEGEETIVELIDALENKRDLKEIKGLLYRSNGDVNINPPRPYIDDLDTLPFPARHLLKDIMNYRPHLFSYKRKPWTSIITSRGCPYHCVFCSRSVFGNKYRYRSAQNIFQEMKLLKEEYGMKEIFIADDTFTIKKDRVEELCNLLVETKLGVIWSCLARANTLTKDLLEKMKKAGCWQIHLGIESGDERILELIRKKISLEQVRNVVGWADEIGIAVKGFFMLGHIGETKESIQKTIDFARSLPLYTVNFCLTFPLPGTELADVAAQFGEVNLSGFSDMTGHPHSTTFIPKGFTEKELLDYQRKAYLSFYLRPSAIRRILFSVQGFSDIKSFFLKLRVSFILLSRFLKRR